MTGSLFEDWVRKLDRQMANKKRKICLIVDNCSAHPHLDNLTNIDLVFFPPNTTAMTQPCDQGIIWSLKVHYR